MSTFLDINVMLELLLPERKGFLAAQGAIESANQTVISPLSAHLYVHFGRKGGVPLQRLTADILECQYTAFGPAEISWAVTNRQNDDFEDALQVACAVMSGCRTFVTFDGQLANAYGRFIEMKLLS